MKAMALLAAVSSERGVEHFMIHPSSISTPQFIRFLGELSQTFNGDPLYLFMDNMSVHRSKESKEAYAKLKITPIFNIPYCPPVQRDRGCVQHYQDSLQEDATLKCS